MRMVKPGRRTAAAPAAVVMQAQAVGVLLLLQQRLLGLALR
jgi:hypothetical protein